MFRNNNTNTNNNTRKPYCKVCHDAGKPESEYTSHYVRSLPDRTGKTTVICPTLLNTNCRYCKKVGHTTKFCPVLAKIKKEEDKKSREEDKKSREEDKRRKTQKKASDKSFNVLYIDSDNSDSEEEQEQEEQKQVAAPMTGYAAALMKPVAVAAKEETVPISSYGVMKLRHDKEAEEVSRVETQWKTTSKWALADSDDEEEEEEDNSAW